MHEDHAFEPAHIGEQSKDELCHMEAELSKQSNKDIVLVAYEKK